MRLIKPEPDSKTTVADWQSLDNSSDFGLEIRQRRAPATASSILLPPTSPLSCSSSSSCCSLEGQSSGMSGVIQTASFQIATRSIPAFVVAVANTYEEIRKDWKELVEFRNGFLSPRTPRKSMFSRHSQPSLERNLEAAERSIANHAFARLDAQLALIAHAKTFNILNGLLVTALVAYLVYMELFGTALFAGAFSVVCLLSACPSSSTFLHTSLSSSYHPMAGVSLRLINLLLVVLQPLVDVLTWRRPLVTSFVTIFLLGAAYFMLSPSVNLFEALFYLVGDHYLFPVYLALYYLLYYGAKRVFQDLAVPDLAPLLTSVLTIPQAPALAEALGPAVPFSLAAADELREKGKSREALAMLTGPGVEQTGEVIWRVARCYSDLGELEATDDKKAEMFKKGLDLTKQAIEKAPDCSMAYLWNGVLSFKTVNFLPLKEKIKSAFTIRDIFAKALEFDGNNALALHALGQWNYGAANLNWLQKKAASMAFGKLPDVTLADAEKYFAKVGQLDETFLQNNVALGKCYVAMNRPEEAKKWLQKAIALPAPRSYEQEAQQEAKDILKKLG